MNPGNLTPRCRIARALLVGLVVLAAAIAGRAQTSQSAGTPLIYPSAIAFDGSGALYVAETGRHVIDRLDATGTFAVVAGTGVQGFAGDGGPAKMASLDAPRGLAVDGAGNLYIADTHNHRVRVVTAATGTIATLAGTGAAGFSGDGGAAATARLSGPTAVALDGVGNLYIADSGNQRIRRVVLSTGVITTVAGSGVQGDAGDLGAAVSAALDTPWGIAVNAAGDLYLADAHNGRVRRVAHDTGVISSVAGGAGLHAPRGLAVDASGNVYVTDTSSHRIVRVGTDGAASVLAGTGAEGFYGDGGLATAALLDGPQATGLSPTGLVTLADTRNQRVRQVDSAGVIRTIGGVGASAGSSLALAGPASVQYGSGMAKATLSGGSGAAGSVSFLEVANGAETLLGTGALTANTATFSTSGLMVGTHQIIARYGGDATHAAAASNTLLSQVTPAPAVAHPVPATVLYGQALPVLAGSLSGVLAHDVNSVGAVFTSAARTLSPAGSYAIGATLVGTSAANYQVSVDSAALTIGQAPTVTSLGASGGAVGVGLPVTISAKAVSTTQGTPTGRLTFLDGGGTLGSVAADALGGGSLTTTALGAGTHSLTAVYSGDGNFLASTSMPILQVIVPGAGSPDFTLASAGGSSQSVLAGAAASYAFTVSVQNGPLNSPILLSARGMPAGATVSFSPALVAPGGTVSNVTFSVQTVKTVGRLSGLGWGTLALLVMLPLRWPRRRMVRGLLFGLVLLSVAGCGEKVTQLPSASSPAGTAYPMVVTATTTLSGGSTLQHTAAVTLIVQ